MIPTPPSFQAAVRNSHQVVSRARIIEPGQIGTGLPGIDLPVISGEVTLDASADIRGTATLELAATWPDGTTTQDIAPYGTEIQISRGIVLGGGTILRVPLGIYRIIDVEQDDAPFDSVNLTLRDRMSLVQECKFLSPVYLEPTMTYGDVLELLIHGGTTPTGADLPGIFPDTVTITWDDNTSGTGSMKQIGRQGGLVAEQDRFGFLNDLLTGLGKNWYFDYQGRLQVVTPDTSTNPVPVSAVDAGKNGVLVSVDRSITRTGGFSAVVVTGQAFDDIRPPRGVALDENPLSPTYFYGSFGQVPYFIDDPSIQSDAQAQAAAEAYLATHRGLPYSVNFGMVPNPSLEPLDCVEVIYPIDLRSDPNRRREIHILEQVQIGLGADEGMMCKTRLSVTLV